MQRTPVRAASSSCWIEQHESTSTSAGRKKTNNMAKLLRNVSNGHLFFVLTPTPSRDSRAPSENRCTEKFASEVDCRFRGTHVPLLKHIVVYYLIKMNVWGGASSFVLSGKIKNENSIGHTTSIGTGVAFLAEKEFFT